MITPTENKARRDILKKVIDRLVNSRDGQAFQRAELFASSSPQSDKPSWQRDVCNYWSAKGILFRVDNGRTPTYSINDSLDSRGQLAALKNNSEAIDRLIRDARREARRSQDNDDEASDIENLPFSKPEATEVEESDAESPIQSDPSKVDTNNEVLMRLLQLTYAVSEAVIDIRTRLETLAADTNMRLARLEAVWIDPTTDTSEIT